MHHQFLGLFIDEWASLIAIGGGIGATIALIMRAVLLPLKNSIDSLNNTIREMGSNVHDNSRRISSLEDRFEIHVGEAKVRNQKIKALEHEVFGRGKGE